MSQPMIMLGGVPIVLHAGAPEMSAQPMAGAAIVRMSDGAAVKMTHWSGKASGSISGSGWMPPGLDGLDFDGPLRLHSTQQESVTTTATSVILNSTPREDVAPWALALVRGQWVGTTCSYADGQVDITPIPGATLYSVAWLPVYWVFASKPPKSLSAGSAAHGWTLDWEEV
jgi:hypothetical protein